MEQKDLKESFVSAANGLAALYKQGLKQEKVSFQQGYETALTDITEYLSSIQDKSISRDYLIHILQQKKIETKNNEEENIQNEDKSKSEEMENNEIPFNHPQPIFSVNFPVSFPPVASDESQEAQVPSKKRQIDWLFQGNSQPMDFSYSGTQKKIKLNNYYETSTQSDENNQNQFNVSLQNSTGSSSLFNSFS